MNKVILKQLCSQNSVHWKYELNCLEKNTKVLLTVTTNWGQHSMIWVISKQLCSQNSVHWKHELNLLEKNTKVLLTVTTHWG